MQSPFKLNQTLAVNQASNKQDRKSQQRRRQINLEDSDKQSDEKVEVTQEQDKSTEAKEELSPGKSCRKSPVKRMHTLEEKQTNSD